MTEQDNAPKDIPSKAEPSAREMQVLDAAFKTFTRYGFARSTMDDIATEAGLSRPALYLHFRNKKDIYRAYTTKMTDAMMDGLTHYLALDGTPDAVLWQALDNCLITPMRTIVATEHGHELMNLKNDMAADIMDAMLVRERALFAGFYQRHGQDAAGALRIAYLTMDALEGAKSRMTSIEAFAASARSITGLVAKLLKA